MPTNHRSALRYWSTPAIGVLIGVVYLASFSVGGRTGDGFIGLAVMVVFSLGLALAGRRSETVRGLLDRRDERITGIDLQATAFTALVLIVAVLIGFVTSVADGHDGAPYDLLGAVGGLAYVAAVTWSRLRR